MAYIGSQQGTASPILLDAISVVNGQAGYTMQKDSVNYSPASTLVMQVSLNGVTQAPTNSYTIDGSTITFASNLATGDVIDYILVREPTTGTIAPIDGSITTSKLVNGAVTDAKITSMAASKLTGALPAISGAALTGISTALSASSTIPAEGGSATTNIVQGLAKMWANVNQATPAASDSMNAASLTDHSTGRVGVNLTSNMSNTNYAFSMTGWDQSGAGAGDAVHHGMDNTSQTTSQCNHSSYNWSGSFLDNTKASMLVLGDLA